MPPGNSPDKWIKEIRSLGYAVTSISCNAEAWIATAKSCQGVRDQEFFVGPTPNPASKNRHEQKGIPNNEIERVEKLGFALAISATCRGRIFYLYSQKNSAEVGAR